MKSARTHHHLANLTRLAGGQKTVLAAVSVKGKRKGMAQMSHMCMCCMMNMPVAGALEVKL